MVLPVSGQVPDVVYLQNVNLQGKVTVLEGEGWQFQFNGNLPFELKNDYKFEIPMGMYHRIIRGKTDLVLRIERS